MRSYILLDGKKVNVNYASFLRMIKEIRKVKSDKTFSITTYDDTDNDVSHIFNRHDAYAYLARYIENCFIGTAVERWKTFKQYLSDNL